MDDDKLVNNILPSYCRKHPKEQIRHIWDKKQWVLNGYPSGVGLDMNHRYECSICGLEVCSPEEFEKRKNLLECE